MSTLELQLRTSLVFDERGRAVSTREPEPRPAPIFELHRDAQRCAWAIRTDVPDDVATELERLAREEPACPDLHGAPMHAERYQALVGGRVDAGLTFTFPERIEQPNGITLIRSLNLLERHLSGWSADEIPERSPIYGIVEDGYPVSVCFSSRSTGQAAEAGLFTAASWRGRGLGPRVAEAWALAIRGSGRVPFYSTAWTNTASLAVARKLELMQCSNDWGLGGELKA